MTNVKVGKIGRIKPLVVLLAYQPNSCPSASKDCAVPVYKKEWVLRRSELVSLKCSYHIKIVLDNADPLTPVPELAKGLSQASRYIGVFLLAALHPLILQHITLISYHKQAFGKLLDILLRSLAWSERVGSSRALTQRLNTATSTLWYTCIK